VLVLPVVHFRIDFGKLEEAMVKGSSFPKWGILSPAVPKLKQSTRCPLAQMTQKLQELVGQLMLIV